MKKLFIFSFLIILWAFQLQAQTPHAMKYQTVIRNNAGEALANKLVSIRASILSGSTIGTMVYQEVHNIATNEFGIANLNIGEGTVQSGIFNNIAWGNASHFLKIEIDIANGSNFAFMGTSQLLSVPYALYAEKSANAIDDFDKDSTNELQNIQKTGNTVTLNKNGGSFTDSDIQQLSINGNNVSITNGNTIALPADYDKDSTNEIQTISKNGNNISLSKNGGNITDSDNQTLNIVGNQLQISNGNAVTFAGTVDMDADPTNEIQTISKNGDTIRLSKNGGSIIFANQHTLSSTSNGTNRTINITGGTGTTFNIADNDNDSTNEIQSLTYSNDTIRLSKSNFVKLPHPFDGQYSSLTGKPNLATVATTGSYNDLINKPSGNNAGDMQYWNGTSWVLIPVGQAGQILRISSNNTPAWSGGYPVLSTATVSSITGNTAISGGNISSDGGSIILARGVCWSTSPNPTISDFRTSDGTGTGIFTSNITNLAPTTTYFLRTYATNFLGTSYGNEISFTTPLIALGDFYQGGIVFYILQNGDTGFDINIQHGLITTANDYIGKWGCEGIFVNGADGINIGTGYQNTIDIVNDCSELNIAAKICNDLVLNGYSDWYLPSRMELNKIFLNKAFIGGLSNLNYWSSSENGSAGAYLMSNGGSWVTNNKSFNYHFKAVRSF